MAKKIAGYIKLQIPAGNANPAPPVGPALGQHGVNIMDFCKQFNAKTQDQPGMIIPVVITVYADHSFSFITKTPPAAVLLKKAAGLDAASGEPNRTKVATLTYEQAEEIAKTKMKDLNAAIQSVIEQKLPKWLWVVFAVALMTVIALGAFLLSNKKPQGSDASMQQVNETPAAIITEEELRGLP